MKTERLIIPLEGGEETSGILSVPSALTSVTGIIVVHQCWKRRDRPMLAHFSDCRLRGPVIE